MCGWLWKYYSEWFHIYQVSLPVERCGFNNEVVCHKYTVKGNLIVYYIDYGNEEETKRYALVELPGHLNQIPPLCKQFALDNMELVVRDTDSAEYLEVGF